MQYKKLLEPGRIGPLEVKNRIVMAPMGTNFASGDGFVTGRLVDYYEERARGGTGLIICGVLSVAAPFGNSLECQIAVSEDKFLPGLRQLTTIAHRHDARIAAQLVHGGKLAIGDLMNGISPAFPSESSISMKETLRDLTREEFGRVTRRFAGMPRSLKSKELSREEIPALVERFAAAAERAQAAGFDGIEIHAAHGYLISSFLSPSANKRQDEYGGDLPNRARFLLQIIEAVCKKVGRDFPVWCRIDCREFGIRDGITPEDGVKLAVMLEQAGVHSLHVSGYGGTVGGFIDAPICYPPGNLAVYAAAIKRAVRIPVIAVGRISPEYGETLLRDNKADFIAMGRPLLADPGLPEKLASGKRHDIRPCIYCYNCVSRHLEGEATLCTVNPAVGRENEFRFVPASRRKNVVVIGGGPAGMETARVAASRGHRVTLFEQQKYLGGSLLFAAIANSDMEDLLLWMRRQLEGLPIDVRLGQRIDVAALQKLNHDAVVVATGPAFSPPELKINGGRIITGHQLRGILAGNSTGTGFSGWSRLALSMARPLLRHLSPSFIRRLAKVWLPLGKTVAVIGGDLVAVELASMLSTLGREVTLLNEGQDTAAGMPIAARWRVLKELRKNGVKILTDIQIQEVTADRIRYTPYGEDAQSLAVDSVILAGETAPDDTLFRELSGKFMEVYQAGNCREALLLQGAIEDGLSIGLRL